MEELKKCPFCGGEAMQRKIPEYVLRKAKEYVETQESILGVRLLGEE